MVHLLHGGGREVLVVPVAGAWHAFVRAFPEVGVFIVVNVDHGKGAEIDGVRAGDKSGIVKVGVEDLGGERFPAAGGTAIEETSPAGTEAAKALLDFRNQLVVGRVAVGAHGRRVDRVRIIVERAGVLDFNDQEAGKAGAGPRLIKAK